MTPATTLASGGRRHGATAASTPVAAGHPTNCDNNQLSAGMTATLFAQLQERAAIDLVADIVRGVLDESRQSIQDPAAESAMIAARQRLERLIRAGSQPEQRPTGDGTGQDRTTPVGGLTPTGSYQFANRRGVRS